MEEELCYNMISMDDLNQPMGVEITSYIKALRDCVTHLLIKSIYNFQKHGKMSYYCATINSLLKVKEQSVVQL